MLLGVHVSIAGHIYDAIDRAQALGCSAMQIFSRDPRQWRKARLKPEDIDEFRKRRAASSIRKVFVHIPYLINLASPRRILYQGSVKASIEDMREAHLLGADAIVTHMGSHMKSGEAQGLRRITDALNTIMEKTASSPVGILLENTAGSGSWLGYTFEHQRRVIEAIEDAKRIGVCFDTCHGWCAGFDLASPAGYERTIASLDAAVGLERVKLVHLNDSRDAFGSHRDRHEHIGKGTIGIRAFKRLVNDPRLSTSAFILETPKDSPQADKRNLERVRKLITYE